MLQQFLSFLLLYKYAALFVIVFLAAFALPLPSTALLLAAGAFAAQGYLNFFYICGAAFLACVLGDSSCYAVARRWGGRLGDFAIFGRILRSARFQNLEKSFLKHTFSVIFGSRFLITSLGIPVNLLAGLSKISFVKFLAPEVGGQLLYVFLYTGFGYFVGSEWQYLSGILENIAAVLLLLAAFYLFRRFYWKRV